MDQWGENGEEGGTSILAHGPSYIAQIHSRAVVLKGRRFQLGWWKGGDIQHVHTLSSFVNSKYHLKLNRCGFIVLSPMILNEAGACPLAALQPAPFHLGTAGMSLIFARTSGLVTGGEFGTKDLRMPSMPSRDVLSR
jgi:hypothetical protein